MRVHLGSVFASLVIASGARADCIGPGDTSRWCESEGSTADIETRPDGVFVDARVLEVHGEPIEGVTENAEVTLQDESNVMRNAGVTATQRALMLMNSDGKVVAANRVENDELRLDGSRNETISVSIGIEAGLDADPEPCDDTIRDAAGWPEEVGPCDDTPSAPSCAGSGAPLFAMFAVLVLARRRVLPLAVVALSATDDARASCDSPPSPTLWCELDIRTAIDADILDSYDLDDDTDTPLPVRVIEVTGDPVAGATVDAEIELVAHGPMLQGSDVAPGSRALLLLDANARVVSAHAVDAQDRIKIHAPYEESVPLGVARTSALDDDENRCVQDINAATEPRPRVGSGGCNDTPGACTQSGALPGALVCIALVARRLPRRRAPC